MDWQLVTGAVIAALFFLLQFVVKHMPRSVAWAGIVAGGLVMVWSLWPNRDVIPIGPAVLFIASIAGLVASVIWYFELPSHRPQPTAVETQAPAPIIFAQGGKGGDAIASNGGVAYAGPGGSVAIGGQGIGGKGGDATAEVANVESAGGAGGSVGSDKYWPHPAKSGYETMMLAKGLPVDPAMRPYGRGGAVSGYEPKLEIVNSLRGKYFASEGLSPRSYFEDINAVSAEYLNSELEKMGEPWRVKIVDSDEYDFYIP
ncbi:MAG: hypothetical protein AMXMBFR74_20830 [Parvibaculum sp.]|jgi:hypothetical protein|uniref:hypothetical protein n=1 Tax=Parvibaculum sp. TaxID=2024848 RepID=UPI0035B7063C